MHCSSRPPSRRASRRTVPARRACTRASRARRCMYPGRTSPAARCRATGTPRRAGTTQSRRPSAAPPHHPRDPRHTARWYHRSTQTGSNDPARMGRCTPLWRGPASRRIGPRGRAPARRPRGHRTKQSGTRARCRSWTQRGRRNPRGRARCTRRSPGPQTRHRCRGDTRRRYCLWSLRDKMPRANRARCMRRSAGRRQSRKCPGDTARRSH